MNKITVWRILDVNCNRIREGLRVLEETARYHLEDTELSECLKKIRHEASRVIPASLLMQMSGAARDTAGDIGTNIQTVEEGVRTDLADIVQAASKRVTEALRVIEEYVKLLDDELLKDVPARAGRMRYRIYDLEILLSLRLKRLICRPPQWGCCVLLTKSLCRLPWREVLMQILAADVDCIQIREKKMASREYLEMAEEVMGCVQDHARKSEKQRPAVIINDRPDIAMLMDADGVHVGQSDLPVGQLRQLLGPSKWLGLSTSNLDEAKLAKASEADYCGVGPMFPTTTKHKPVLAGADYLKNYVASDLLPHLAIGGITLENMPVLIEAGCRGVAVSSSVCASEEPGNVVNELNQRLCG